MIISIRYIHRRPKLILGPNLILGAWMGSGTRASGPGSPPDPTRREWFGLTDRKGLGGPRAGLKAPSGAMALSGRIHFVPKNKKGKQRILSGNSI